MVLGLRYALAFGARISVRVRVSRAPPMLLRGSIRIDLGLALKSGSGQGYVSVGSGLALGVGFRPVVLGVRLGLRLGVRISVTEFRLAPHEVMFRAGEGVGQGLGFVLGLRFGLGREPGLGQG